MTGINDTPLVSIITKKTYFTLIKTWTKTIQENVQLKSEMNKENH